MEARDKNYNLIDLGMYVEVPDPDVNEDIWNHSFVGSVLSIDENGYVTVEDGDGDCFMVECERLEITD